MNISKYGIIILPDTDFVKKKAAASAAAQGLLLPEGHAVCALVNSGIGLMGTYQNPVQRTVVLIPAMVGTLCNGALDALVGMAVHKKPSFEMNSVPVCPVRGKICVRSFPIVALYRNLWYAERENKAKELDYG